MKKLKRAVHSNASNASKLIHKISLLGVSANDPLGISPTLSQKAQKHPLTWVRNLAQATLAFSVTLWMGSLLTTAAYALGFFTMTATGMFIALTLVERIRQGVVFVVIQIINMIEGDDTPSN